MEREKYDELTEMILNFKKELEEKIKQENEEKLTSNEEVSNVEILNIIYYARFTFKTKIQDMLMTDKDIYIVELDDNGNKICEIYKKNVNHKIAEINVEGEITFCDEKFDDNITLSEMIEKNMDKETYEMKELNKEEMSTFELIKKIEEDTKDNNEKTKYKDIEYKDNPEEEIKGLEESLKLGYGNIRYCTKVITSGKDNIFRNKVPESRQFDEIRLVYLAGEDQFRFIGLKQGQKPKFLESIESSKQTMKKTVSINRDGTEVKQEYIKGLMKFKDNDDYDFAVKVGQYGCIELSTLRKDPTTNRYMSTELATTSQKPNQKEVDELMNKDKNKRISEEINRFDEKSNKQGEDAQININDISDKGEKSRNEVSHERYLGDSVERYYSD